MAGRYTLVPFNPAEGLTVRQAAAVLERDALLDVIQRACSW
jgi:hypothetical protein